MVLLAGLTLACGAQAGESAQEDVDLYFNGVKVAIDPATGRLRQPTPQEIQALRASVTQAPVSGARGKAMPKTRADAQRTLRKRADGIVSARVSEDMMMGVVATRQADGSIRINHEGDAAQEAGHE
jgi:hypothetical protein